MESKSVILNELREISPVVAGIDPQNTYRVPHGYFEGLADTIMARIKAENAALLSPKDEMESLSPLLNSLSRKLPYEVPQDYFSELSENIVGGAKAIDFVKGELQTISPLMESLKHKNVYEVPAGYFDGLADNILDKVKSRKPARVVTMGRRITRYAVAAVIAGIMAIGGWMYFNNTTSKNTVASVEKMSDDSKVSDDDMTNFLENATTLTDVAAGAALVSNDDMDESDIKEMLSDVSDEELQQYLTTL